MNRYACILPVLCSFAASVQAQPANSDPQVPDPVHYPAFDATLTPVGEFAFSGDLKGSPGTVSVARAGANLEFNARIDSQFRLGLSVDAEGSWYRFRGATALIPGTSQPFNDVYLVRLTPSASYAFNQQWSVLAGAIVEFAGEPGADLGDSFTAGGFGGVRVALAENFALTLGAAAKSSLEDDAIIYPLVGIEWQITPTVSFSTAGPGARLTAELTDSWAVFLQAGFQLREYRLDDDSPLPAGVARDARIPVTIGLTWQPAESVKVTLRGGVVVWQEFEIDNAAGLQISETNTKPAPFIGLSADFQF